MELEGEEPPGNIKTKKRMVSLSNSQYEDIFEAVIHSTAVKKELNDDSNNFKSNFCSTEKTLERKKTSISQIQQRDSLSEASCQSNDLNKKKHTSKFRAPIKSSVTNANQNKSKKFTPPIVGGVSKDHHVNKNVPIPKNSKNNVKQDINNMTNRKKEKESKSHTIYEEADTTEHSSTSLNNQSQNLNITKNNCSPKKQDINKTHICVDSCENLFNHLHSSEEDKNVSELEVDDVTRSYTLSQASNGSMLINENPVVQLSQPSPELNQRQRLEWLRKRRDVGVWVQCCKLHCCKWRYLEHVKDPIDIPEYWDCQMNSDERYNTCDKPERGPKLNEHVDLINNKYTAGSLVWARLDGFPWWPALVDDDPDIEAYYWLNGFSDIPTYYHVVFFDDQDVTRAWITPGNMHPFTGKEKERKFNVKYFGGINYSSRINAAKDQAKLAYALNLKDRLEQYGFLARFKGPIGAKKSIIGKHQRKISCEPDLYASDESDGYDTVVKNKKSKFTKSSAMEKISGNLLKDNTKSKKTKREYSNCKTKNNVKKSSDVCKKSDRNGMKLKCKGNQYASGKKQEKACIAKKKKLLDKQHNKTAPEVLSSSHSENVKDPDEKQYNSSSLIADVNENEGFEIDRGNEKAKGNPEDIDPFQDEEIASTNDENVENYELNIENKTENVSCSNIVKVGAGKPENGQMKENSVSNEKSKVIQTPQFIDVEKHEADTSEDATMLQTCDDPLSIKHHSISQDGNTVSEFLDEMQKNKGNVYVSNELDAVVPEVENCSDESDPFEDED